jgi:hypothetical protein
MSRVCRHERTPYWTARGKGRSAKQTRGTYLPPVATAEIVAVGMPEVSPLGLLRFPRFPQTPPSIRCALAPATSPPQLGFC